MPKDRATKALLLLVAVGLWGLLLRPLIVPAPAEAQVGRSDGTGHGPTVLPLNASGPNQGYLYAVFDGSTRAVSLVEVAPQRLQASKINVLEVRSYVQTTR